MSRLSLSNARFGAERSRLLLVDTLKALDTYKDAVTVIGAHAVHVWVSEAWGAIDMEATRDADIVINPTFVSNDPKLVEMLKSIDVEPALKDRPGVYGIGEEALLPLQERTTVDLIVPEVYAGAGRRAARIDGQSGAAGRAVGLELAVWDRHQVKLSNMDDKKPDAVMAYVAGPAALLISKVHKVHERLNDYSRRPDRLRPKDSGDIALLMMVSDPGDCADIIIENCKAHPEIMDTVSLGVKYIVELYADTVDQSILRKHAAQSLAARFDENEVFEAIDTWINKFNNIVF